MSQALNMHHQSSRQLQEQLTALDVPAVLAKAVRFFQQEGGIYTAFLEKQGPSHVVLRGQGGEEVVIGARSTDRGTMVSGSTYLFDQQVARFLTSLPPAPSIAAGSVAIDQAAESQSISERPA